MSEPELVVGETSDTILETAALGSVNAVQEILRLYSEIMHVRWSGIAISINTYEINLSDSHVRVKLTIL